MRATTAVPSTSAPRVPSAPPPKISLGEAAYEAIKWRILQMEIRPGSFINVQALADTLGLGRSPVHAAVLKLQHDGLLEVLPRKGIVVRAWSRDEMAEILEARLPIEIEIARLAAERIDRGEARALKALVARGHDLIGADDREGLMQLDREFHQGLAKATRNTTMVEIQRLLHQRSTPLWFTSVADRREYAEVQEQHEALLAKVAAGDAVGAAKLMQRHLGGLTKG